MPDTDRLIQAIDAAESASYGGDSDGDLQGDRAHAIDLYAKRNVDPSPEGRSQAISADVFDTIEWMKPSLVRIFTSGDDVVRFEPVAEDDIETADQETAYTNYVVTAKNPWFQIVSDWFADALLTKNAYAMAYYDKSETVEKEKYEGQSDDSLALLMQDKGVELIGKDSYPSPDGEVMQVMDPMTGQPMLQPVMLHDVEIKRKNEKRGVVITVLPPERCKIAEITPSFTLDDCPYFEFWEWKTLSDLRAMGFDVPDDISDDGDSDASEEEQARDHYGESSGQTEDVAQSDPSMRRVRARMIWIKHDYDGDGIAELQYVLRVGNTVLFREDCNTIPVACIVPVPVPHRHIGFSAADMTVDIQAIKTAILRQGLDNLYLANNGRTFATDKINIDDLLVSRPGGIVRGESGAVFGQDIAPIPTQFMFPQAMEGMEYMDQIRENRTGTNRYFTGIDQNSLNKTASGIAQLSSSAAQRVEHIARVFAVGVERLFHIVHELILKHGHKADTVRLRGKWVTVDPRQWKRRADLAINVGMGTGNKEVMLGHLTQIFDRQMMALPLGITKPAQIFNTLAEMTKAAGFGSEKKFWTNPEEEPPPEQGPPPEIQVKQMELQSQEQIKAAELKHDEMKTKAQMQLDKYKIDADIQTKMQLAERQSIDGHADRAAKFGSDQEKAEAKQKQEEDDAMNKEVVQSIQAMMQSQAEANQQVLTALAQVQQMLMQTMQQMSAKKRHTPVRGEDGRLAEIISETMQ